MRHDLSRAEWRKSSYSGNTGNCAEVAIMESVVGIRDSKDPQGPVLVFTREQWAELVQRVKRNP